MNPRFNYLCLSLMTASATFIMIDLSSYSWAIAQGATKLTAQSGSQRLIIAQTVEDRKAEADRLLQQGIEQYQKS